jgi:hypothetical protein
MAPTSVGSVGENVSSIRTAGVGDVGFTVYASLSGEFCVDFVPPAVDLSVCVSDRLMEVDGTPTRGKSHLEVVNMLRGPIGSHASIRLFRFPQAGAPFFVETTLLRLPVLSEELRSSMYPNYASRKGLSSEVHVSTAASAPLPTAAPASLSVVPEVSPAPSVEPVAAPSTEHSQPQTDVVVAESSGVRSEAVQMWSSASLSQVPIVCDVFCSLASNFPCISRQLSLVLIIAVTSPSTPHVPHTSAALALDGTCRRENTGKLPSQHSLPTTMTVRQEVLGELKEKLPSTEYSESVFDFSAPVASFDPKVCSNQLPRRARCPNTAFQSLDSTLEHSFVVYSPQSTLDVFVYGFFACSIVAWLLLPHYLQLRHEPACRIQFGDFT